jgi:regulation of enolase protein 1 (concanavalin A-like superfamily)
MRRQYLWPLMGAFALFTGALRPAHSAPPTRVLDQNKDIGSPATAGSTMVDANGNYTIQGSGADVWGNADSFQYAYTSVKGDGSIIARILSQTPADPVNTKTGPMIRETDAVGATHVFLATSSGNGVNWQWRDTTDGATDWTGPNKAPAKFPNYMRIQRAGNDLAGFVSDDGTLWRGITSTKTIPMAATALFGLAVTSHSDGDLATATFDKVSVQPGASLVYGLSACGADKAVMLQWTKLSGADSYNVYRAPSGTTDPSKFTVVNDKAVTGTTFTDATAGLADGTTYSYLVAPVSKDASGKAVEGSKALVDATPLAFLAPPGFNTVSINEGVDCGTGAIFDATTGVTTVRGSGADIWGTADQFNFTSQPATGNFQAVVKLVSGPTHTADNAKTGLMIREGTAAGSRHLTLGVTGSGGLILWWRDTTDGDTNWPGGLVSDAGTITPPVWLRLTRKGDVITPESSTDGKTWQPAGDPQTLTGLAATVNVGLAITSWNRGIISEAQFSNISITKQ